MRALVVVDIQNDFVEGGALAVPGGSGVIDPVNRLQPCYELVVATQDWHPENHGSFAENHPQRSPGEVIDLHGLPQVLWPAHCIEHEHGADFVASLDRSRWAAVFQKGTDPSVDSYSGFFDNGRKRSTGLGEFLRDQGVREVHLVGLATDYCVKATALDAAELGFRVGVITDATCGVDLQPGDSASALQAMRAAGASLLKSHDVLAD